jgi:hypothetical protein
MGTSPASVRAQRTAARPGLIYIVPMDPAVAALIDAINAGDGTVRHFDTGQAR